MPKKSHIKARMHRPGQLKIDAVQCPFCASVYPDIEKQKEWILKGKVQAKGKPRGTMATGKVNKILIQIWKCHKCNRCFRRGIHQK